MKEIKVGVQAMMLKEKFAEIGAYETMRKISEIGYGSVEISQIPMTAENVDMLRRGRDDFGVKIAALSSGVAPSGRKGEETIATHFDKLVGDCEALDCHFVRIGMLPFNCMGSLEAVLGFCRQANEAAKRLRERGIALYYHNHHIEFRRFGGETMLNIIRENAPELGFELDVHWIQRGGMEPVKVIGEYAGKVDLIHLKDYRIGGIAPAAFEALGKGDFAGFMAGFAGVVQFAEVGEGNIDMAAVIECSLAAGAKHFFIEQDDLYGRDVFDCLKTSYDNIRALGYFII